MTVSKIRFISELRKKYLCASLFIGILMLDTVHLQTMRLQWASLGEGFLTKVALVGTDARVSSGVSFQVESIVESLATERAEISFHIWVTFHVTIKQSLESEVLWAHAANKLSVYVFFSWRWCCRWALLFHGHVSFFFA